LKKLKKTENKTKKQTKKERKRINRKRKQNEKTKMGRTLYPTMVCGAW
jgi:hypothetical protein